MLIVEPYSAVVHLGVLGFKQIQHLGACPENRTVAVGCHDVNYGAGKSPSRFYEAGFMVGDICFRKMYVGECYGANRFDFVIGMDIISLGRFTLTGSGDERRMEFEIE